MKNHFFQQFTALLSARAFYDNFDVSGLILGPGTLRNLRKSIKNAVRKTTEKRTSILSISWSILDPLVEFILS